MHGTGLLEAWAGLHAAVAAADPLYVGGGIALLGLTGAAGAWRAYHHLHHARTIEDIPTCKARSVHQGYAELEGVGRLMDGPPIVAPLSGLPCCWYRYRIEEEVVDHDRRGTRRRWVTLARGESAEVFWLEDETGRVAIDPEGAEVTPRHKDVWRWRGAPGSFAALPAAVVRNHAPKSANRHRYTEERINVGEVLYALGLVQNIGNHVNPNTVQDDVRQLLLQWKRNPDNLRNRFDLNRDGRIDAQEWALARRAAWREVKRTRREELRNEPIEPINLMRATGDARRPYLLSAFPQSSLTARYRRRGALYLGAFFLAGTTAIWLFNVRFALL